MREASLWRLFARGFSSPQGPVQRWARRRLATAEACVAQAVALEVAVRTNSVLQGHANYQESLSIAERIPGYSDCQLHPEAARRCVSEPERTRR